MPARPNPQRNDTFLPPRGRRCRRSSTGAAERVAITIPEGGVEPVAVAPTEVGSVRPSWSGGRLARVAHKVVELGFLALALAAGRKREGGQKGRSPPREHQKEFKAALTTRILVSSSFMGLCLQASPSEESN